MGWKTNAAPLQENRYYLVQIYVSISGAAQNEICCRREPTTAYGMEIVIYKQTDFAAEGIACVGWRLPSDLMIARVVASTIDLRIARVAASTLHRLRAIAR